jgi:hypothetical protein
MKMNVFFNKLPLSSISAELVDDVFSKEVTINSVKAQIEGFINF